MKINAFQKILTIFYIPVILVSLTFVPYLEESWEEGSTEEIAYDWLWDGNSDIDFFRYILINLIVFSVYFLIFKYLVKYNLYDKDTYKKKLRTELYLIASFIVFELISVVSYISAKLYANIANKKTVLNWDFTQFILITLIVFIFMAYIMRPLLLFLKSIVDESR